MRRRVAAGDVALRDLARPGRWFAPADAAGLAFFRVAFGVVCWGEVVRALEGRRAERYYLQPAFRFSYYGFEWVTLPPGDGIYWLYGAMALCAAGVALGCLYRLAAPGLFFTYTWLVLLEQARYNNHYYLMSMLAGLLALMPAHAAWSVDALARRGPRPRDVPLWCYGLLRFQMGVVYYYGGLAKLNADWLLDAQPMRLFLEPHHAAPGIGSWLAAPWAGHFFAWSGTLLDLLIVPALLLRRTRAWAFAVGVAFHFTNAHLFSIGVFPWLMIPATMIFFEPAWPRRLLARWGARSGAAEATAGGREEAGVAAPAPPPVLTRRRRVVVALLVAWAGVQLVLPFRHHLIPGDVAWTDEGHRFSWRMKLRSKRIERAMIEVTEPSTGRTSTTYAPTWLKRHQYGALTRPDMLVQFAHHVATRYRALGWESPEVRFYVTVSLNGRRPELLLNPSVDLAAERRSAWRPLGAIQPAPTDRAGSWRSGRGSALEREAAAGEAADP